MNYIKLGQIASIVNDLKQLGASYLEDENGVIVNSKSLVFPLNVLVEVIDWVDQVEQQKHGKLNAFYSENLTIPDQSVSIRQSVFNQLIVKYPNLHS